MTHWVHRREEVANLGRALAEKGWILYGWTEDKSDSMTDYYAPEHWNGVAAKGGAVVVVDRSDTRDSGKSEEHATKQEQGPCSPCGGTGKLLRDAAGYTMTDIFAKTSEHFPAEHKGDPCKACDATGSREEYRSYMRPLDDPWPAFQANPGRSNWHVERDGKILAKGVGLAACRGYDFEEDPEHGGRRRAHPPGALALAAKIDAAAARQSPHRAMPENGREEKRLAGGVDPAGGFEYKARLAADGPVTITRNEERDGLELRFSHKPDETIRAALKGAGFRWHFTGHFWYAKDTPNRRQFAEAIAACGGQSAA